MVNLVALAGYKESGKSTVAEHLNRWHGYKTVKFAQPLKDMLRALGLNERHIEGDLKEKPSMLLGGQTPRHAMQTLGTEWGRDLIHPDIWVEAWADRVRFLLEDNERIVVDDLRFTNELRAVEKLGGEIVYISRDSADPIVDTHPSEHLVELIADTQCVMLPNNGTIEQLKTTVDALALEWSEGVRVAL